MFCTILITYPPNRSLVQKTILYVRIHAFKIVTLIHYSEASLTCLEVETQLLNTRVLHLDTAEMICHVECGGWSRV